MKHKHFINWQLLLSFTIVGIIVGLSGCMKKNELPEPSPVAYVSINHFAVDAPSMDVLLVTNSGSSNSTTTQLNTLPFRYSDASGYVLFKPGELNLRFTAVNTSTPPLLDLKATLVDSSFYSLFLYTKGGKLEYLSLTDNAIKASSASGKANLRFVNLSPDAGLLRIHIDEEDVFFKNGSVQDISFEKFTDSSFVAIDAGARIFQAIPVVNEAPGTPIFAAPPSFSLIAGRYYTLVAKGYVNQSVEKLTVSTYH